MKAKELITELEIDPQYLFLPEFTFIELEDALPGGILPKGTESLIFKEQLITPLIPLNSILLDYFTPEELISRLQFKLIKESEQTQVKVILNGPFDKLNNHSLSKQVVLEKTYYLKEENALTQLPVLEIWPNFKVEGWQEYYAFYYDTDVFISTKPEDKTFQVSLPEAKEPHIFNDGKSLFQVTRLEKFPLFIECQDKNKNLIGLIIPKLPEIFQLKYSWKVGVDFGTSFTNIYVNRKDVVGPLPLENLHLKVTDVEQETRLRVLTEFFIPGSFIPLEKPLPLSNLLTTRKSNDLLKERPLYDGRIYIPAENFNPQDAWIETNININNSTSIYCRLFLKNLALLITAIAAKNGVKQIQWCLSYPDAFSQKEKYEYAKIWQNLTRELASKTGIIQHCPDHNNLDYFRTESLATAQYFADSERLHLVNSTCINMNNETSNISIWQADYNHFQMIYQCSIQLAGKHLFSQFLELKPKFLADKFGVNLQGLKQGNFNAKLDVLLRYKSESWLKKRDVLIKDLDFQRLIRLMAIETAGLYYYVGIILKVLYATKKYKTNEITPVYVGGNGSRLLNWLAVGGQFDRDSEINKLLSRMLSKASGFQDIKEITRLSTRPEDEVACGLVLERTSLRGVNDQKLKVLIPGEDCMINNQPITWNQYLELEGDIKGFDIPDLIQVPIFLNEFNHAVTELEIDGLIPMSQFKPGVGLEFNYKNQLWRDVYKELKVNLLYLKTEENICVEPPFILGLKALLSVLAKEWAGK